MKTNFQALGVSLNMRLSLVTGDSAAFGMFKPVHEDAWQVRGGSIVPEPWNEVEFASLDNALDDFIAVDCLAMNTGTDGFLVSTFARDVLSPLMRDSGQFLPARVFGIPYWWLNCLGNVKALDHERTDSDWNVVDGAWGSFSWITTTRRLEFCPNKVEQAPILFRVPEYPQGVLLAKDDLQTVIKTRGLTGFKFELVWSAAKGGVANPAGTGFGNLFVPISTFDVERRRNLARQILGSRDTLHSS